MWYTIKHRCVNTVHTVKQSLQIVWEAEWALGASAGYIPPLKMSGNGLSC